jgi:hypothetical protein
MYISKKISFHILIRSEIHLQRYGDLRISQDISGYLPGENSQMEAGLRGGTEFFSPPPHTPGHKFIFATRVVTLLII